MAAGTALNTILRDAAKTPLLRMTAHINPSHRQRSREAEMLERVDHLRCPVRASYDCNQSDC
jgi:hypothetical protein